MGGIGTVVGAVGSTVGGFVDGVTATPTPDPVRRRGERRADGRGARGAVHEPATTDLVVTVPSDVVGEDGNQLRIYLALKDQAAGPDRRGADRRSESRSSR